MTDSQNSKDLSDERLRKLANRNDVIAAMAKEIMGLRRSLTAMLVTTEMLNENFNMFVLEFARHIDDKNVMDNRAVTSESCKRVIRNIKKEFSL